MTISSQSSSSSPYQVVSHQTLPGYMQSQSHTASSSQTACNKALSIESICLNIFSFLSIPSLQMNAICHVNPYWRGDWTNHESTCNEGTWKVNFPQNVRDESSSFTTTPIEYSCLRIEYLWNGRSEIFKNPKSEISFLTNEGLKDYDVFSPREF